MKRKLLKQKFTNSLRISTKYRKVDKSLPDKLIILISTEETCSFNLTSSMTYHFMKFKSIEDFKVKCHHHEIALNSNVAVLTGDFNSSITLWDAYRISTYGKFR